MRSLPDLRSGGPTLPPTSHPVDRLRLEMAARELAGVPALLRSLDSTPGAGAGRSGRDLPVVAAAGIVAGSRAALLGLLAEAARGQVVAGIGLGADRLRHPFDRLLARRLSRQARLLVVRSEAAARRMAVAGVPAPLRVGADLAWLSPSRAPAASPPDDTLVIGGMPDPFVGRVLADALPAVAASGLRPVLGAWSGRKDGHTASIAGTLRRRLPADRYEALPPWQDAADAVAAASASRNVLALDVDAQVVAALGGSPAVVVSDDEECLALAGQLGQTAVAPSTSDRLLGAALAGAVEAAPDLRDTTERFRRRARESLRLLHLVLSGGRSSDTGARGDLSFWPEPR